MERKIQYLCGHEIGTEQIKKIKEITKSVYPKGLYEDRFKNLKNVKNLAKSLHDVKIKDEKLILGDDWFLCYSNPFDSNVFEILELSRKGNNIATSIEMLNEIKHLLLDNRDKLFITSMRHTTSYKLYLKMLKAGYFKEISLDDVYVDDVCPISEPQIVNMYITNNDGDYIDSTIGEYMFHDITFKVTDKFINKYDDKKR